MKELTLSCVLLFVFLLVLPFVLSEEEGDAKKDRSSSFRVFNVRKETESEPRILRCLAFLIVSKKSQPARWKRVPALGCTDGRLVLLQLTQAQARRAVDTARLLLLRRTGDYGRKVGQTPSGKEGEQRKTGEGRPREKRREDETSWCRRSSKDRISGEKRKKYQKLLPVSRRSAYTDTHLSSHPRSVYWFTAKDSQQVDRKIGRSTDKYPQSASGVRTPDSLRTSR